MLGRGSEWRVFHFTQARWEERRELQRWLSTWGLLTPLSGETLVTAAEQAQSRALSSVLLARRGTFYPLICLCDKHNVLSVHLDLEDAAGFVFLFPLINQSDFKCGNTAIPHALGVHSCGTTGVKHWWTMWKLLSILNISVPPLVVCCKKA